jgi:ADP-ribosylation factor GTPase-activating protein 2/3
MSGNIKADGTVTAAGNGGVCIPTADKNAQFRKLKNILENQTCFDCPNTRPTWASVTYGMLRKESLNSFACFVSHSVSILSNHAIFKLMFILGVFLCLDCSAAHRSMGVHLTVSPM